MNERKTNEQNYCRWAPSLGSLANTHQEVWGTKEYNLAHIFEPTVFFGMYDLRDYLALWLHKGKKWVLWAGSDILNLKSGFIANDGKLKLLSMLLKDKFKPFILSILKNANHWVENEKEQQALLEEGIPSNISPSFLGKIEDYPLYWNGSYPFMAYTSSGSGRQEEYGFGIIENIAPKLPKIQFYLYGADWKTNNPNVIVRGRIPQKQMDEETKGMHLGLRLNNFDGFSEILAKAVLRGHYAIGKVKHPHIPSFENEEDLIKKIKQISSLTEPNLGTRQWYIENLNKYPWVLRA